MRWLSLLICSACGAAAPPPAQTAHAPRATCEDVEAEARLVLERQLAVVEEQHPEACGQTVCRGGLEGVAEHIGRCIPAGRGAWILVPTAVSITRETGVAYDTEEEVERPSYSLGWRLEHLTPDGQRVTSEVEGEVVEQGIERWSQTVDPALVFDFDGDGVAELVLHQRARGDEELREGLQMFGFAGGVVDTYRPTRDIHLHQLIDHDGDGRMDIVSIADFWRGSPCGGLDPPLEGLPPVLFHSRFNGTFSAADDVAASYLRGHCPAPPDRIFGGASFDELEAVERIACARLWGQSAAEVGARMQREWRALPEPEGDGERCGWGIEHYIEQAAIDPPLVLR